MKYCPTCDDELQPRATFCLSCGTELSFESGNRPARPSQSHPNHFRHSQPNVNPQPSGFQRQRNHHSSGSQIYSQLYFANLFTVRGLISRMVNMILKPKTEWVNVYQEQPFMVRSWSYALMLLLIPAISNFMAYGFIGVKISGLTIKSPILGLQEGLMTFICGILSIYATALVVYFLAPGFNSEKKFGRALQLVVYSMTPFWVAGIMFLVPGIQPIVYMTGIYVFYLMFKGLPVLLRIPGKKITGYLTVSIIGLIAFQIIFTFLFALTLSLFFTQEINKFSFPF